MSPGYEIRAMSLGEILDGGFRLVRDHFVLLVGITATVQVPIAVLSTLVAQGGRVALAAIGALVLLALVAWPVAMVAATFAVGEVYVGRAVSIGVSLRAGLSLILPVAGTLLLYTLAMIIGLLLLIVPGIYLSLVWLLLSPIMVLERQFGPAAFGRSRELMRGHLLRGLGLTVVSWLIVAMLTNFLQLILGFVPVIGALASGVATATGTAYALSVPVLLYFDIRCRKEGFDVEHLARLVEAQMAPA